MDNSDHCEINFEEKFNKIKLQFPIESEESNVLWCIGTDKSLCLGHLPYLLILNKLNKFHKTSVIISSVHGYFNDLNNDLSMHDDQMELYFEFFNQFDIGDIMKSDNIYYTKDYQKSLLQLSRLVNIEEVVNIFRASDLMSILFLLNNIIYFNITHVLINEHETILYQFISSLLLNQYGKILKILEIPSLPYHHSINQIHEELTSEQKLRISKYIQFMLNTLYPNEEKFSNDISDIFDDLKRKNNLHTYIAVSFLTDQFHVLRNHWKKNTNKNDKCTGTGKGINDLQTNQEGFEPSLGGKFIIINWNTNEIVYELDLDAPAGFFIENNILYIANNRLHYISIINLISRKEIRRIENSSFNCLHSLQRAENESILITSTGIDAIIQINFNGDTINDWYATEHGYNLTPKGEKRFVQRDFHHHHYIYPTLYQTTHINSAIILDSDYFLATLFHQGLLIKINRKNGKSEVLLSGLHCPHGIKRYKSMIKNEIEWMLCNTKQNELLFLNKDFQIIQNMILEDINWLQDATQIQNGNIILTDANHSRIIEIDQNSNDVINEFEYSNDWRIYQINDLTDFQTNFIPRNTKIN